MKKLKLVALLAVLALTVAAFVTMLVMPTSAAANTSKTVAENGDTTTSTTQTSDANAISNGYIGRFGDTEGSGALYVKSLKGAMANFGNSGCTKFNLLVNMTTSARVDFSPANKSTACVFNGNGCTITTTATQSHRFYGKVTYQNITITGSTGHLLQIKDGDVILGSGCVVNNTKAGGHNIIIDTDQKLTVDGATIGAPGSATSFAGKIYGISPWGTGCTINIKSGTVKGWYAINESNGSCTINVTGGNIVALDDSTGAGTSDADNDGMGILLNSSNSVVNFSNATISGAGVGFYVQGSNNIVNFSSGTINSSCKTRGAFQYPDGTNNTLNVTGGTVTSQGYGIVANSTGVKVNISGGSLQSVTESFIHIAKGSNHAIRITGNPVIVCGNSTSDHTGNFVYGSIANSGSVTVLGGTIYCGDIFETGGTTDAVVNIKGGTFNTENALYSTGATAGGVLNISGGDITCTNGAIYVTTGNALLNIYDGAKINAKSLVRVRYENTETGDTAATGCGRLRMFGGDVTTTSDAINLELNTNGDISFTSDIEIYGGTITAPNSQLIDVVRGGSGHIAIYGGEFKSKGRVINVTTGPASSINIDVYGGTFKSLYNSTDDGKDTSITTGIVFISAEQSHINVYGGRFYILTDLNDITKLADTGAHLVPWAGAINSMNFYAGEFYGGTHVQQRLAHASGKVDTSNSTYIEMTTGGYKMLPVTKEGASIRLSADSMGIRFQSTISKAALDNAKKFGTVTYGTIITPLDFGMKLGAALLNNSSNYVKIAATSAGTTTDASGNVTFNAALTNIQAANLGRQFVACAYIEITTTGGEVITIYSTDKAIRSIDEVAKAALADYKTEAEITDSNKDTYKYMTTIYCDKTTGELYRASTTPVYTRFNNAQIAAIAKQTVIG